MLVPTLVVTEIYGIRKYCVVATLREGTSTSHLHVKIVKKHMFKHPFLFFILMQYVMMIKTMYRFIYFNLKNAERPKRMGHNTCKSMGAVLCVVGR